MIFHLIGKKIIAALLTWEARAVLKKYQPKIVAVTGSVGKTSTKDAIYTVFSKHFRVRRSVKSYNSELGLPLTIIGCETAWLNPFGWLKNLLEGISLILFSTPYPEWLILELGVDRPGDIKRLASWLRVDVAVITRLPDLPVHVEFFSSAEALAAEKLLLLETLKPQGVAILNYDDERSRETAMRLPVSGKLLSYGFADGATVRASNIHITYEAIGGYKFPNGTTFKINYVGNTVPMRLKGIIGEHQLYGILAAATAGLAVDINLVDINRALEEFSYPAGRMKLIPGIKNTLIIDDSYNSSPAALESALKTLGSLEISGRKIAVLGDMLELGQYTIDAHRQAGLQAAAAAQLLFTVGIRSKFISDEAAKKLGAKTVEHFYDVAEAGKRLQELLEPGDVILVKGSQALRLERVVEEVMAHPEDKKNLLCRQESEWQRR